MKKILNLTCCIAATLTGVIQLSPSALAAEKPNIVFVITDDQGYGDLGCHGHPYAKTPNVDALAAESVSLDDYHVGPTCSPSRASILTGHWTNRTGVWHTINGRSMIRENEVLLATLLSKAGYATGMFGKWHLGDNYPYRPEDRGFTEVYRHGGGGVGQTPDVWDNSYFDGGYFHNGKIVPAKGFCTDVFFDQANIFIRKNVEAKKPFFAYISTNAPHGPLHCPQKYMDMYEGKKLAAFYGMITNIDDNVGKTRKLLAELGATDNTIFVYTTDNGTAYGHKVYTAGMRGRKGSEYDGGHRVPFFMHWPAAGMNKKKVLKTLFHAVDIVPTLVEICGAEVPEGLKFDGVSILSLLTKGDQKDWPERFLVTDSQRVVDPVKWKQSAVMSQGWRLINGKELYDMSADPEQKKDVSAEHPEQFAKMRDFYEKWWAELEPTFAKTTEIYLGHPEHPKVTMTSHDWISQETEITVPWNQRHIRKAQSPVKNFDAYWAGKVITEGKYSFELRRWAEESDKQINEALPAGADVPGTDPAFRANIGKAITAKKAVLKIDGKEVAQAAVKDGATSVTFTAELTKGSHKITPYFELENGKHLGAYYLIVRKLP